MTGLIDPAKPPCPWCLTPLAIGAVKRWHGHSYCPHCQHCVVKYLSQSVVAEAGVVSAGWYWGKHSGHEGVV